MLMHFKYAGQGLSLAHAANRPHALANGAGRCGL